MLFYRKSGVKNAIFLDFRAFYALKCVCFKAFCSFRQVIFASNTNFNTKNYTKTIPILIPVLVYTPMAASCQMLSAIFLYLIISQIARKINVFSIIRSLIFCLSWWLIVAQSSKKSTRKNMTENLYKLPYKSSSNTWLFLFYPNVIFFCSNRA